ncbi:MAG TPA: glycosyltransferase [Trueperaceae bacterium]|nr:glycosyltransferase [Trueperaceae bacterium]
MSSARSSAAEPRTTPPTGTASSARAAEVAPVTSPAVAILIPAFDEQLTIAAVVRTAVASGLGPVIVIDDGSRDATAAVAADAGAEVVRLAVNSGKGGALAAGARHVENEFVVLLDADLVGLGTQHIVALADPVLSGSADMSRGVFKGGRLTTTLAQLMAPQLNGQRCLRREALLGVPGLAESRYGVEVVITRHGLDRGWRLVEVPLWGVTQVMKEEKRGLLAGLKARARMYWQITRSLLSDRRR